MMTLAYSAEYQLPFWVRKESGNPVKRIERAEYVIQEVT